MRPRAWVLLFAASSVWGAAYMFIKVALDDGPSFGTIVVIRVVLGALVLMPVALRHGSLRGLGAHRGPLLLMALMQVVVPFLAIAAGERWIATGMSGILMAAEPVLVVLFAPLILPGERVRGRALAGIGVGLLGVVLLFAADLGGLGGKAMAGGGLILLAALSYAIASLYLKRRLSDQPASGTVAAMMTIGAVLLLPLLAVSPPHHGIGLLTVLALLALGLVGTGVSFLWYFELIYVDGPTRAAITAYISPLFAVLYGVVLLGERFTAVTAAGMLLILGGSWFAAVQMGADPAHPGA